MVEPSGDGLKAEAAPTPGQQAELKLGLPKPDVFALEAYKQFAAFHNVQETLFWTRNNILVVLQTGLFAVLVSLSTKSKHDLEGLGSKPVINVLLVVLALVGLLLALIWTTMVQRSDFLFKLTLRILSDAETEVLGEKVPEKAESKFAMYRLFVKEAHEQGSLGPFFLFENGALMRHVTIWALVGKGFAYLWTALLLIAIYRLACL